MYFNVMEIYDQLETHASARWIKLNVIEKTIVIYALDYVIKICPTDFPM